jgi:hypothetical protein
MNRFRLVKTSLGIAASTALLVAAIFGASLVITSGADPKTPDSKSKTDPAKESSAPAKSGKKKLTGAELYALHCNRCHPERYATEWNVAQWKTIMLHMRVRANLPATQAKEILKYLQEDSGN